MTDQKVLYAVVCAARPARDVDRLVRLAQDQAWDVCVVATPSARRFIDVEQLAELSGHPVRSEYKHPDEPDVLPPPDAVLVAPATVNTMNKWAAGICDTLALGIIVEGIGLRLPMVAVPRSNRAHAAHPAFAESVSKLRSWGVTVLWDPADAHEPRVSSEQAAAFQWAVALEAVTARFQQDG